MIPTTIPPTTPTVDLLVIHDNTPLIPTDTPTISPIVPTISPIAPTIQYTSLFICTDSSDNDAPDTPPSHAPFGARESLVSVYNHFSQLVIDLKRNKIELPNVTINTKFLNCLQPEWYKYFTNVHLARNVKDEPYDVLFDYLQQYKKLVIASRAKKAAKIHDPLALVANTSSFSSRSSPPYYVTHPPYVVDYDDDYQGDTFSVGQEDSLTSAMMLLTHAITQRYSTPTNN
ncbi:hypothetical protein Tco_0853127 [Tanacetum coccineum]